MNKKAIAVAALALALISPVRTLLADEHNQGKKGEWKQKLGLTDDQVKKLDDSKAAEKAEMAPLKEKHKELTAKLKDQVKNKAGDADLKATLDEMAANHKAKEAIEEKYEDGRASILTPTQQAKMTLNRMHRHEKMEKGKKGKEKEDDED